MSDEAFLRALPKVELHCHLEGSVPPETAIRLARKNGVSLPSYDPESLYAFTDLESFLTTYVAVSRTMVTAADFAEVTYESLAAAAQAGNLRYREMAFNPTNHPDLGLDAMLAGIADGVAAARVDHGVDARVIVAINREQPPSVATALVGAVLEAAHPLVVGVGLDHNELAGAPSLFAPAYALAGAGGLKRTAHAGERGNAAEIAESIALLGLDRVDHGYAVLRDPALLAAGVASGIHYATCWSTALFHATAEASRTGETRAVGEVSRTGEVSWTGEARAAGEVSRTGEASAVGDVSPIGAMIAAGLSVSVSSDDPPYFGTDIGGEFAAAGLAYGWSEAEARERTLIAARASFLPDDEKKDLVERLISEMSGA